MDLTDPDAVVRALLDGAEANRAASCRRGAIDLIEPPGTLIATGDLHDNPVHYEAVLRVAGLDGDAPAPSEALGGEPVHLTLHEIIHSERLMHGVDLSYRVLVKVAALKARCPERVHTLIANHELAQLNGSAIVKNGVKMVRAFSDGIDYAFGDDAHNVELAVRDFIRSMPLGLRCRTPMGDILCCHSLPGVQAMGKFDTSVLHRELTEDDYAPRTGPIHMMTWGRGYDPDQIEDLVARWGVRLFILGHEHAHEGARVVPPAAVVLNSDHDRGVYLPIDLSDPPGLLECPDRVRPLSAVVV